MAHIYFIPRGIEQQLQLFKIFLQSQMWPWVRTNLETGKKEVHMFQGALRDLGFCWCYTFPEQCLKDVCDMLDIKPNAGGTDYAVSGLKKWAVRRVLGNGVRKLPKKIEYDESYPRVVLQIPPQNDGDHPQVTPWRFVEKKGVSLHILGWKKDEFRDFDFTQHGKGKYYQEAL